MEASVLEQLAPLAERAARVTGVSANPADDSIMVAMTTPCDPAAALTTACEAAHVQGGLARDDHPTDMKRPSVRAPADGGSGERGLLGSVEREKGGGETNWAQLINVHRTMVIASYLDYA